MSFFVCVHSNLQLKRFVNYETERSSGLQTVRPNETVAFQRHISNETWLCVFLFKQSVT